MIVTIRDRATEEASWGRGLFYPVLRTVTIAHQCPVCGGPRGEPIKRSFYEDGVSIAVDCWKNPCGHIDSYSDVLAEASA